MKICTENSLLTSGFGGTMPSSVIGRLTEGVVRLTTGIFSRQLEPRRYLPSQPEPLHLIEGGRNGRLAELPASAVVPRARDHKKPSTWYQACPWQRGASIMPEISQPKRREHDALIVVPSYPRREVSYGHVKTLLGEVISRPAPGSRMRAAARQFARDAAVATEILGCLFRGAALRFFCANWGGVLEGSVAEERRSLPECRAR
jgi:hypothetical protein